MNTKILYFILLANGISQTLGHVVTIKNKTGFTCTAQIYSTKFTGQPCIERDGSTGRGCAAWPCCVNGCGLTIGPHSSNAYDMGRQVEVSVDDFYYPCLWTPVLKIGIKFHSPTTVFEFMYDLSTAKTEQKKNAMELIKFMPDYDAAYKTWAEKHDKRPVERLFRTKIKEIDNTFSGSNNITLTIQKKQDTSGLNTADFELSLTSK